MRDLRRRIVVRRGGALLDQDGRRTGAQQLAQRQAAHEQDPVRAVEAFVVLNRCDCRHPGEERLVEQPVVDLRPDAEMRGDQIGIALEGALEPAELPQAPAQLWKVEKLFL